MPRSQPSHPRLPFLPCRAVALAKAGHCAVRHLNLERGIRAAALLNDLVTQGGNLPLHEEAATGLGRVLQICAGEIARIERLRRASSSPLNPSVACTESATREV